MLLGEEKILELVKQKLFLLIGLIEGKEHIEKIIKLQVDILYMQIMLVILLLIQI